MKRVHRIAAYLSLAVIATLSALSIYLSRPWIIEIAELRSTGELETIHAYWGRACGEDFLSEEATLLHLDIYVPQGGMTPAESGATVPDNLFVITGYRYKRIEKNYLTGKVREYPSGRVDAIEWHVVPPYQAYVDDPDVLIEEMSTPLGWMSLEAAPEFSHNQRNNSHEC